MPVVRLENRKINSLNSYEKHLISPPNEEVIRGFQFITPNGLSEIEATFLKKNAKRIPDFFKSFESEFGKKRIRKDASIREVIIAFEEGVELEKAEEELKKFLAILKQKLGFFPIGLGFFHRKDGRIHVHFLFSLKNPETKKKVNLNRGLWFQILDQFLDKESKKRLKRGKTIGNIPLWVVRKIARAFEEKFEPKEADRYARELVRMLRRLGVKKSTIYEISNWDSFDLWPLYLDVKKRVEELEKFEGTLLERKEEETSPGEGIEENPNPSMFNP